MSFVERQKARYATRQRALSGVQPDPPTVILWGSSSDVLTVPKPPVVVPQQTESSQQKWSADVEQSRGIKDTQFKRNRTEETSKENHSNPRSTNQQTRTRSGDNNNSRDKDKEPAERDSAAKTSTNKMPSWHREGFQVPVAQTELINLLVEINKSAPALTGLSLSDPRVGQFMGDGVLERCIDFDTLRLISSVGDNDSLGLLGSHLSQVSSRTIAFILIA